MLVFCYNLHYDKELYTVIVHSREENQLKRIPVRLVYLTSHENNEEISRNGSL